MAKFSRGEPVIKIDDTYYMHRYTISINDIDIDELRNQEEFIAFCLNLKYNEPIIFKGFFDASPILEETEMFKFIDGLQNKAVTITIELELNSYTISKVLRCVAQPISIVSQKGELAKFEWALENRPFFTI